jgi:hypothetical protein
MIIRLPVQTAVWPPCADGSFVEAIGAQASVAGSYRALKL